MTRWWTALRCLALISCAAPAAVDAAADTNDVTSAASSATSATNEDYDTWTTLLAAKGITVSQTTATLVGVRSANTRVAQKFDDRIVVLTTSKTATSYAASTHPWFQRNAGAPDVDGDGIGDVGMLKPGSFHATLAGSTYGAPKFAVVRAGPTTSLSGSLPGWRNTNGDDQYEDFEIAASEARGDMLTEILVHAAGPGSIAPIGCQVMAPADVNAIAQVVGSSFDYVLIDAPPAP